MSVYAFWNNKGGVGKSYLTFQVSCEYASQHPSEKVLVIDLCPQANSSGMILGGMTTGESSIEELSGMTPSKTISGYIADRIVSPYVNPHSGASYLTNASSHNTYAPTNLYLVCGDEELELQSSQVQLACTAGPSDAWRIVHTWIRDLIEDVRFSWNQENITVFIDCNPSFTIYTELAMTASDRLLIPFSADGSSKRAVRSVLSLVYGALRKSGQPQSAFFNNAVRYRMSIPQIYMYVGNRLTQMNQSSASAYEKIVTEIFSEVFAVWQRNPAIFCTHPSDTHSPTNRLTFKRMFEQEIDDANAASVVSGALGIPICRLTSGDKHFPGRPKPVHVNQSQLEKQQPNIREFVSKIE